MLTWRSGVKLVERARGKLRQPEEDLIETAVTRCHARLAGTAVFLASAANGVPLALTQFVKHNHVPAPARGAGHGADRGIAAHPGRGPRRGDRGDPGHHPRHPALRLHAVSDDLSRGWAGLRAGQAPGIDLTDITYYIGRETIIPSEDIPGMWLWRETVFAFLQRNAERSAAFFGVPTRQVVEFGTEIEI